MKRISFHLNSLERGGAERVVSTLAGLFAEHGYEVSITTEWYADEEYQLAPGIKRVHVGLRDGDETKGRWTKFRLRIRYLREFLETEKPDVCVSFTHRPNYRALSAARGTGIPVVIAIRDDPKALYSGWDDKIQIPLLFPRAAGAVFQTGEQKAFFAPRLQDNSAVILNPLNPKYLSVNPARDEERRKEVVMSSRLVRKKNQAMLLRAFQKVHEKHGDYILKIYGKDDGHIFLEGRRRSLRSITRRATCSSSVPRTPWNRTSGMRWCTASPQTMRACRTPSSRRWRWAFPASPRTARRERRRSSSKTGRTGFSSLWGTKTRWQLPSAG